MNIGNDAEAFKHLQALIQHLNLEPVSHRIAKATYTEDCLPDTRIIRRSGGRKAMNQLRATGMPTKPETPLVAPSSPLPEPPRVGRPPITEIVRKMVPTANHKYIATDESGTVVKVFTGRKGLADAGFHYQPLLVNAKLGKKYKGYHWRFKKVYEFRMVKQLIGEMN